MRILQYSSQMYTVVSVYEPPLECKSNDFTLYDFGLLLRGFTDLLKQIKMKFHIWLQIKVTVTVNFNNFFKDVCCMQICEIIGLLEKQIS